MNRQNIQLTPSEQKIFTMLRRGGRYTLCDITHEAGPCMAYGIISSLKAKGIGIASTVIERDNLPNHELFWIDE